MTTIEKRHRAKLNGIELLIGVRTPVCTACGEMVLLENIDFHHTDRTAKKGNPSEVLRKKGVYAFYAELLNGKCIPVCKDCHREIHKKIGYK